MDNYSIVVHELENLYNAKYFISRSKHKVILTNTKSALHCYGVRVLDYMFKELKSMFPDIIIDIKMNTDSTYSAIITAEKLGYQTY